MMRAILKTMATCLLLVAGPAVFAGEAESEEPAKEMKEGSAAAENVVAAAPAPQMSPADNVIEFDSQALAVTGDPNAYIGMAPGICLVVDDIVRQYCAANPGDISCQFQ